MKIKRTLKMEKVDVVVYDKVKNEIVHTSLIIKKPRSKKEFRYDLNMVATKKFGYSDVSVIEIESRTNIEKTFECDLQDFIDIAQEV